MLRVYNFLFNNNYQPKDAGFVDKHLVYPITNIFSSLFYKLGFTPNMITLSTLVMRSISMYNIYYKTNPDIVFKLFFLSWFTDALDGIIARKYNMKTIFGAYLDSIVDAATLSPTIILLYFNYYNHHRLQYFTIIGIFVIHYLLLSIKIKNKKAKNKNVKPWENWFSYIPINIKSNFMIDSLDPGLSYIIYLYTLYNGLFMLK
jgi:phosphatidylglycerophosphate synthase